jgi:hypothetical protein
MHVRKQRKDTRMKRQPCSTSTPRITVLTLASLALLVSSLPALAAQPALDLVPLKGVHVTGGVPGALLPLDPPEIVSSVGTGAGQSDLVGPYTTISHFTLHLSADGKPLYQEGDAVWTTASGDALSFHVVLLFRPPTSPGTALAEGVWTISSGRGRFLGATGSGVVRGEADLKAGTTTITSEGIVTRPKQ